MDIGRGITDTMGKLERLAMRMFLLLIFLTLLLRFSLSFGCPQWIDEARMN